MDKQKKMICYIKYHMCRHDLHTYLSMIGHSFMRNKKNKQIKNYMIEHIEHMPFNYLYFSHDSDIYMTHNTYYSSDEENEGQIKEIKNHNPLSEQYHNKQILLTELIRNYNEFDCNMKWVTRNKEHE